MQKAPTVKKDTKVETLTLTVEYLGITPMTDAEKEDVRAL